jgi:hypothetical protein
MLFAVGYGALILGGTCVARNRLSLLNGFDLAPLVGWWLCAAPTAESKSKIEFVRRSVLAIPAASAFRDAKEAERFPLAQCGRYGRAIDAIFDEILERHRQLPVVIAPVVAEFQLDTR